MEKHLEHPESSGIFGEESSIQAAGGEALSQRRTGVGTKTRWFYRYKGRPFIWDDIVTEWDPGKRIVWHTTSGWNMEDSFTLDQDLEGTRLVYTMRYRLPYGPIGYLYGRLILEPRMNNHLKSVLEKAKELSENPLGPTA